MHVTILRTLDFVRTTLQQSCKSQVTLSCKHVELKACLSQPQSYAPTFEKFEELRMRAPFL